MTRGGFGVLLFGKQIVTQKKQIEQVFLHRNCIVTRIL